MKTKSRVNDSKNIDKRLCLIEKVEDEIVTEDDRKKKPFAIMKTRSRDNYPIKRLQLAEKKVDRMQSRKKKFTAITIASGIDNKTLRPAEEMDDMIVQVEEVQVEDLKDVKEECKEVEQIDDEKEFKKTNQDNEMVILNETEIKQEPYDPYFDTYSPNFSQPCLVMNVDERFKFQSEFLQDACNSFFVGFFKDADFFGPRAKLPIYKM